MKLRTQTSLLCLEPLEQRRLLSGYTLTVLPGPEGAISSEAHDLNASGQVIGSASMSGGQRALLWNNGVMIDLGTLGGDNGTQAINDRGQIVGWASNAGNSIHGFLINPEDTDGNGKPDRWFRDVNGDGANDLMIALPFYPSDINNSGQVIGGANGVAVLWTPATPNGAIGTQTDLPLYPKAINDAGQIIGSAVIADANHVVLWRNGVITDLGAGLANAINRSGQVIGASALYAAGFLWTPTTPNGTVGTFTGLEDIYAGNWNGYSEPLGLNNADQVVGWSAYTAGGDDGGGGASEQFAILWDHALNRAPGVAGLETAVAINDAGQFVGHTTGPWELTPPYDAYLLTPIPTSKTWIGPGGAGSGGNWSTAANWSPSGAPTADDLVTISAKSVNFPISATFATLTLTAGASLTIAYPGASPIGSWNASAYTGVTGMVQNRRINTSPSGGLTAVGVVDDIANHRVLVKQTWAGDANLDGKINVDDYGRLDAGVTTGKTGWSNGDFNYDGKINVDDYGVIDFNVGSQAPPLGSAAASRSSTVDAAANFVARPPTGWEELPANVDKAELLT